MMQMMRIDTNGGGVRMAFFGSSRLSVIILDELGRAGIIPACIITTPDKPQGRKLTITPNIVKTWALEKGIPAYDPAKLDEAFVEKLKTEGYDIFIVASYGKIIPKDILNIPLHKTLNVHPSLLPTYRGPSPLPTAMLEDAKDTGVTIMRLDEEMDHGPTVAQEEVRVDEWPIYEEFEETMARTGARLLARILPDWIAGTITEREQDHSRASTTRKIVKEDGLLDRADLVPEAPRERAYTAFRKIQAFHEWPQAYFMIEHNGAPIRVKVTQASFKKDAPGGQSGLVIERVIPEGKKEMSYEDFAHGYLRV